MNTMETNFRNALKDVRKAGIKTRLNVMECCRGCVTNEKLGIENDNVAIIWTYGGQGHATSWVNGLPYGRTELAQYKQNGWSYRAYDRFIENTENMAWGDYFNHNALTDEQKETVYNIFTAHGFVVNWDKETRDYKCIEINYKETFAQQQTVVAAEALINDVSVMY